MIIKDLNLKFLIFNHFWWEINDDDSEIKLLLQLALY